MECKCYKVFCWCGLEIQLSTYWVEVHKEDQVLKQGFGKDTESPVTTRKSHAQSKQDWGRMASGTKQPTAFRNSGKYWDRNEIGKLQSSNISLSFLGIFGRYDNCKNFPVPKEVLVGDQYLSKAWGKTFWAAIKELCIRASTESEHSITLRCTRKLLVAWKQKTSLNLPTSPLEQSLR